MEGTVYSVGRRAVMFSHRRRAQVGLAGGLVVLMITLTILFQGSRAGMANWQPADAGQGAPAPSADARPSGQVVNIASLIK
jgi:hypothetical protein